MPNSPRSSRFHCSTEAVAAVVAAIGVALAASGDSCGGHPPDAGARDR